jgi:DNA-binding transcriptional MerR regulator
MVNHYTIQQAAEITGVSAHTLRYYERIGLLDIGRAANGHRRYTDADIGWVEFILLLRGTNMRLPDIAVYMQLEKEGDTTIGTRRAMLQAHRKTLTQHIAEQQTYLDALDAKIDHYRDAPDDASPDDENDERTTHHEKQSTRS